MVSTAEMAPFFLFRAHARQCVYVCKHVCACMCTNLCMHTHLYACKYVTNYMGLGHSEGGSGPSHVDSWFYPTHDVHIKLVGGGGLTRDFHHLRPLQAKSCKLISLKGFRELLHPPALHTSSFLACRLKLAPACFRILAYPKPGLE